MTSTLERLVPRVFVMLATIVVSMSLVSVWGANSSQAAESAPTLTVHVTSNSSLNGYDDTSLADQILPKGAKSAGAGYVYKLSQLDASTVGAKLSSDSASSEKLTSEILAQADSYLLEDGQVVYGISDSSGTIATTGTATQGSWVKDAQLTDAGSLVGGTPMTFEGTSQSPTFWLMKLVHHPTGVNVKETVGLVELPYSSQVGTQGEWNYQVNLFPKLVVSSSSVPPANKCPTCVVPGTQLPNKLAQTGSSALFIIGFICACLGIGLLLRRRRKRQKDADSAL
jgi:LPXTG-motif cell wall-anchored protein